MVAQKSGEGRECDGVKILAEKMVIDAKFKKVAHTPSTAKSTQVTILSTSNQRLIFYETKLIDKIFLFPTMQLILISYFKCWKLLSTVNKYRVVDPTVLYDNVDDKFAPGK